MTLRTFVYFNLRFIEQMFVVSLLFQLPSTVQPAHRIFKWRSGPSKLAEEKKKVPIHTYISTKNKERSNKNHQTYVYPYSQMCVHVYTFSYTEFPFPILTLLLRKS